MASQALYRKWRSQTFSEVVGQEAVIQTLRNALKSGNLAHAYLFTGPRGTGKTTTARLLAKTINCLHPINNEPCNECQQCREITSGSSFNVIEIDAASNRGIDSIRELREKVMVPPTGGKYKVYILDEAHMLTVEAFNALLKTLEEPPPHAIFVLATTDVHKLLPTVLSRCQRYDFKRFTMRQLIEHLERVAGQEQVQLESGAAELIARAAAGGMRDALSLLDQAIAYSGNTVSLAQVQTMLGVADPRAIQKFILYVAQLDSPNGLHLIAELMEAGADLRQINSQIAEFWRSMMLARAGADISEITDSTDEEVAEIKEAARHFRLDELIECARIFAQNDLVQKSQGTPQLGLELAFLSCVELHRRAQGGESVLSTDVPTSTPAPVSQSRSAAPQPRPVASVQSPMAGPVNLPRPPQSAPPAQTTPPVYHSTPTPPPTREEPREEVVTHQPAQSEVTERQVSNQERADEMPTEARNITASTPVTREELTGSTPYEEPALSMDDVREKWELVKRRVKTKKNGAKIAAFLNGYALVTVQQAQGVPIVVIQANYDFHYQALQSPEPQGFIEWALKVELGMECRIKMLAPGASGPGIAAAIPPPPKPDLNGNASNALNMKMPAMTATLTPPPARTERPVEIEPVVPPPARIQPVPDVVAPISPPVAIVTPPVAQGVTAPLARTSAVRENISVAPPAKEPVSSSESRRESITRKAPSDPVVQEVVRMFKAEIKDIQLK